MEPESHAPENPPLAQEDGPAGVGRDIATPPEGGSAKKPVSEQSLRVNVEILDSLMNMVGELVLTRNQLLQIAQAEGETIYDNSIQHLNRVTSDVQGVVMKTRMQPIGNAWSKLPRLVRDPSQSEGKKIELVMRGAETELDRQVLQVIQDPLTHLAQSLDRPDGL